MLWKILHYLETIGDHCLLVFAVGLSFQVSSVVQDSWFLRVHGSHTHPDHQGSKAKPAGHPPRSQAPEPLGEQQLRSQGGRSFVHLAATIGGRHGNKSCSGGVTGKPEGEPPYFEGPLEEANHAFGASLRPEAGTWAQFLRYQRGTRARRRDGVALGIWRKLHPKYSSKGSHQGTGFRVQKPPVHLFH